MPATASPKRSVTSKAKSRSAKVGAAKPAAKAKAAANGNGAARRSADATLQLANDIKAMRDAEKSWAEIKAKLGVDPAQGQFLIKVASVRPKDRIKYTSDNDLAKQARALRKEGLSKAEIAARAGTSVGHVRKVIGANDPKPTAKAGKTAKAKAAPKAKAAIPADAASGAAKAEAKSAVRKRRRRAEVAADPSPAA